MLNDVFDPDFIHKTKLMFAIVVGDIFNTWADESGIYVAYF